MKSNWFKKVFPKNQSKTRKWNSLMKTMSFLSNSSSFSSTKSNLRKHANETFRHPWDAISEALDIIVETNDVTDHVPFSKYLVVFVFGDVVPLVNRNTRPTTKKMTILWQQNVQEMNKRNLNYEKLIEKLE